MDSNTQKVMFSHSSDEWSTPQWLFDELDSEFHFTLDPCASESNHKCERYYTKETDGLKADWSGERVFCNPPYSDITSFARKAFFDSRNEGTVVALLVPSRTDTKWFQDYCYMRSEIRFISGRLKFNDAKTGAPFPSMLVIFRGPHTGCGIGRKI